MTNVLKFSDYGLDSLFRSGRMISKKLQINPWDDEVVVQKAMYHGMPKKMFIWALLNLIFIENDEVDPRIKINNSAITPKIVKWYQRASEFEASPEWDADQDEGESDE
jgi:hypothetical protein